MTFAIFVLLLLTIIVPFGIFLKGERSVSRYKNTLLTNVISFVLVLAVGIVLTYTGTVSAAEEVSAAATSPSGWALLAAGLPTCFSCSGAALAVSSAASAAIGAISENDSLMGKTLIFVALGEGIAIYGLIVSIMILGKL